MKNFNKEDFKTGLLVALFVLSIALNQQLWERISLKKITPYMAQTQTIEIKRNIDIKDAIANVLRPQGFRINFGGGLHTVLSSDTYGIWKETIKIIKKGYFEENLLIEPIDKAMWTKVSNFRSIEMTFGYTVPVSILRETIEGKKDGIYGKINGFNRILVSLTDDLRIYMQDNEENIYLVQGENIKNQFSKIMNDIEKSDYDAYYTFDDLYGIKSKSLMPIEQNNSINEIQVIQEIDPTDEAQVKDFAGTFFGENLDFIRKIRETSGSVIYLYGYGQKALKINDTGILHYIEDIDEEKASKDMKIEDAMKMALRFISEHGGWANTDTYLKEIKPIEKNNKKGYKFLFGYRLNGIPVYCVGQKDEKIIDAPIEVELLGEQVVSYKRFLKREEITIQFLDNEEDTAILPARQIIDRNFNFIKNDFLRNIKEKKRKEKQALLEEILSTIEEVKMGYYDMPLQKSNTLIPIWIIKTNQMTYYFDAYSGEIINSFEI